MNSKNKYKKTNKKLLKLKRKIEQLVKINE